MKRITTKVLMSTKMSIKRILMMIRRKNTKSLLRKLVEKVEREYARKKIAAKTTVTILTTDTRMKWKKRIQNMQALAEMGC